MRRLISASLLATGLLAGCATQPMGPVAPGYPPPPPPRASLAPPPELGPGTIVGRFASAAPGAPSWNCEGQSVIALRATPATVERMRRLYGSVAGAAAPVELVRSRSAEIGGSEAADPPVASANCQDGEGFRLAGLPRGSYFVIARARLRGGRGAGVNYALMRRADLRPAETVLVTFAPPEAAASPNRRSAPVRRPGAAPRT